MADGTPRRIMLALVGLFLLGCTNAEEEPPQFQDARLAAIAQLLGEHVVEFGRKPANDRAFREFVASRGPEVLEQAGAKDIDELLTSPRDGEKFVIIYPGQEGRLRGEVWAYEAAGKDGSRAIVDSLGRTLLMPENDFRRLVPER
jgi:hypothetical protein